MLSLPNEIARLMRLISQAYVSSLPSLPGLMEDRYPRNMTDSLPISCMIWNVQGAGSKAFLAALKELIKRHNPKVLALVETHMGGEQAEKIATLLHFTGHTRVDAVGFSGGIWIYWKKELVTVDPIIKHEQFITMTISRIGAEPWYFSAVYASPDPTKRTDLWRELRDFAERNNEPWLIAGDFNETRFPSERSSSCRETTRRSHGFNEWIDDLQLMEVEFSGALHTWARGNSTETRQSARLDRALCNVNWSMRFERAKMRHLPAIQSDHCPLFISPNGFVPLQELHRPFKFQATWLTHENFQEFVREKWDSTTSLVPALDKLATELKVWNRDIFGNIFQQKKRLLARIAGVQKALSTNKNHGLIKLETHLRRDLDEILEREEILWYQKSRIDWISNGDRNTSFFHLSTIGCRWRNNVVAIQDDLGDWIYDKEMVKNQFVTYFTTLFAEEGEADLTVVPQDVFPELAQQDWERLSKQFVPAEIEVVIQSMSALKAPGPDGFQALFYQKNWELISSSVYKMVLDVLQGKGMPSHLNDTFLALIPKVEHPEKVSQFRPIGLCNVGYKIITKTLVNRLKPILPSLISNTQSSFVPGRQITDNIVIMQEVLHTMRRKQGVKGYMAIKIDFEKAYDRLRWSFIRDTLHQMNLPLLLINVIMECISTAAMQVLWNGEPTAKFHPTRGIRQGDPLSPYLFVMCMERLYQTIEEAIVANRWRPIYASRNGPKLSNLFFADDIVLFAEASVDQAQVIHDCLRRFCLASGQKISLPKSRVYFSKNVDSVAQQAISMALNIEATDDLGLYLGMPTLTSSVTKEKFQYICERIDRRLMGWKTKYLSLAGRITLAKSTLTTLANYPMQATKLPRSICDNIDKKVRKFIWGGSDEKRGNHLIAWEQLQKPHTQGGLAIPSARQANSAFLSKLGWRVLTEPNALWARVLRAKYCHGRCDVDMFVPKVGMSNVWRGITDNAKVLCEGIQVAVGNGHSTLFWDHRWATSVPLIELAAVPVPTELLGHTVEEMWDVAQGWKWDVFAPYLPQDVLRRIQSYELKDDPTVGDLVYWREGIKGKFSIKSALAIMRHDNDMVDEDCWKLIWGAPVQQRIRAFLWIVCHERLLGNVMRFKRHMTDDPKCFVCGAPEESTIHILRDCPLARMVWKTLGGPAVASAFYTPSIKEWITMNLTHNEDTDFPVWTTLFCLSVWWIWKWRNCIVFGRNQEVPQDIGAFLQVRYDETRRCIERALGYESMGEAKRRKVVGVRWHHPPVDFYVLNSDGAAKGAPGIAGGGAIIRDHRGGLVSAMAMNFGVCHAFKAEVMALHKGLEMAKELQIHKLQVQLDNIACVQLLQAGDSGRNECTHLLRQCIQLIQSEAWEIQIRHVYREGNKAADWLANLGVTQLLPISIFSLAPRGLSSILDEDIRGVSTLRAIPP